MRLLVSFGLFVAAGAGCTSPMNCSLNGDCAPDGTCHCYKGWHGNECELLSLQPASPPYGYGYAPNISSWGAHVVKWSDGLYHMFVAELWGGCGITSWRQNSHIVRATSRSPLGPYVYNDTALPPESTCNHVMVDGNDIVLFHQGTSGAGTGKLLNCTAGWAPPQREAWTPVKGHKVHYSTNGPAGPWAAGGGRMPDFICNNPSPLLLPNKSVAIFCHGPGIRLALAPDRDSPYANGSASNYILKPGGGPRPHTVWEDPYVYFDRHNRWHLLSHVYPTNITSWLQYADVVAGHAFSETGEPGTWTFHATPPYNADVTDADGSTRHYATRERPFLLLDDTTKDPVALFTSVTLPGRPKQNKSAGGDYSFTHVQPVG